MTFKYFSGFSLEKESELFKEYINENAFTVCGFSYGAIKAFEEVYNGNQRVDTLQLFSPAFFQTEDKRFKRTQLMFFKKDENAYCDNFLENISFPSKFEMKQFFKKGSYEELEELLNYQWNETKLQELTNRGVKIEVYLGEEDKIFDSLKACEFFRNYATVYFIKNVGHILKEKE